MTGRRVHVGGNLLALNAASVAAQAITVVIALLVARLWGDVRFGQYTFVLYLAGLVAILVDFGMETGVVRDVARDPASTMRAVANGLALKGALGILVCLILGVLGRTIPAFRPLDAPLIAGGCYVVLRTILAFLGSIFRAHERMVASATVSVAAKGALLAATVAVMALGGSLTLLFAVYAFALGLLIIGVFSRLAVDYPSAGRVVEADWLRRLAGGSLPFATALICSAVIGQMDIVALRFFHTDAITGHYGAAVTLIAALAFLPANVTQALYPLFSRLAVLDRGALARDVRTAGSLAVWGGLVLGAIGSLLAAPLLWIFGPGYLVALAPLRWLMWSFGVDCMACVFQSTLFATHQERSVAATYMVLTAAYLAVIWWRIPHEGMMAAAVARCAVSVAFFLRWWQLTQRTFPSVRLIGRPTWSEVRAFLRVRYGTGDA